MCLQHVPIPDTWIAVQYFLYLVGGFAIFGFTILLIRCVLKKKKKMVSTSTIRHLKKKQVWVIKTRFTFSLSLS